MMTQKEMWECREKLRWTHDLIHCITNPISMNDCANAILALGAKPIMASHPKEVAQITVTAGALALNLGNFDDTRAEGMKIAAASAKEHSIPVILDLVGTACSTLRLDYAMDLIHTIHPDIIKGNLSEIRAIAGKTSYAKGVDVAYEDLESISVSAAWIQELARREACVVMCSGAVDIISDGMYTYRVDNGCEMLTVLTGTGCMLNAITAVFMSCMPCLEAALMACGFFGVVAEKCHKETQLPGTFHYKLFDWLYALTQQDFIRNVLIREVCVYENI